MLEAKLCAFQELSFSHTDRLMLEAAYFSLNYLS